MRGMNVHAVKLGLLEAHRTVDIVRDDVLHVAELHLLEIRVLPRNRQRRGRKSVLALDELGMHAAAGVDEFDGNFGPVAMRDLGQQHQAVDARILGDVELGRIIGGGVPVDRRRSQRDECRARPGLLLDKVNVALRRLAICGRVIGNHG